MKAVRSEINWAYYESDEFWQYVDEYAAFIKANLHNIEVYVNVDAIFNPQITWKVQKYMEDVHKLNPLPVVHAGTDISWFKKYMDNYEYIGIGGMARAGAKAEWMRTLGDPVFSLLCRPPHYLPSHKIHGFAMTSPSLLALYPFYSVDSTSWIQFGKYGLVIVPKIKGGKPRYDMSPNIVPVTSRPSGLTNPNHMENIVSLNQGHFEDYFDSKGYKLGSSEFKTVSDGYELAENECWADRKAKLVETIIEKGLSNSHTLRDEFNLQFYLDLEASLPPWPWAWHKKAKINPLF